MTGDLRNPRWMYLKGALFVLLGVTAATLLLLEAPRWTVALWLFLTVWAFCRAYYFAFYVVEKYIDDDHKFSGLIAFVRYLLRRRE